jgi:oligogalacturonide lyase
VSILLSASVNAQIGRRFPFEKKIVTNPVTRTQLTFLTSTPAGDSKIYQTHRQWTADGKWVIFRSNRVRDEAMAVNEKTGTIVQVSEIGFTGMLNVAQKSMKLPGISLRVQKLNQTLVPGTWVQALQGSGA